jgi:hypothetical protein
MFTVIEREIFWREEQRRKHNRPIEITEFGIIRDTNDEHPEKLSSPNDWTELGSTMNDNVEQF